MKTLIKMLLVFICSLIIEACAEGMTQMPQKYALDGQLEQVSEIYGYTVMDWVAVDNQSFIIQKSTSEYYLLVLKTPSPELTVGNRLVISSKSGTIRAGLDEVTIYSGEYIKNSHTIERIYKIKGREQMSAIREQLTGKKYNRERDNNTRKSVKPKLSIDQGVEI
jgi:hypothetical protein